MTQNNLNADAKELAKNWLKNSEKYRTISDKIYAAKMDKFFQNSEDKTFVISMMDKAFRPTKTGDIAKIIGEIPELKFFGFFETILVNFYNLTRNFLHPISVPLLKQFIYLTTSKYVLFGDDKVLEKRIAKNLKYNLKTNLNRVGELLLGQEDAKKRIEQYIKDLENPAINCISIKISTIYSQITSIAFEQVVEELVAAISVIYRAAKANKYIDPKTGKESYKMVNFDMEEYRDLAITVETFIRALSKEEFKDLTAGIALQAYLPDSLFYLQKITTWAKEKVKNGGAPARVRVVKGANMDMELFEMRERHWPLAPFAAKAETDANWKLMLEYALQPANINAVRIGVASHNLFDIAYIYLTAKENKVLDLVTFEMLSGMSEHVSRMFAAEVGLNVLLYLPFASKEEFISAIGYLVRRLDENTSRDNYLRYINGLANSPANLKMLQDKFEESLYIKQHNEFKSNRTQNRLTENFTTAEYFAKAYHGSADTDFSIPANVEFAEQIRQKWQNISGLQVDGVVAGRNIAPLNDNHKIKDHNSDEDKFVGTYHASTIDEANEALACASGNKYWQNLSDAQRLEIIARVVDNIQKRRGDIMGAMALECGKPFVESDAEVSEAIDFGNFYSYSLTKMRENIAGLEAKPKQAVLVLSPWNFPFAIPAGGIFSGLIAGSNVIFKPSNFTTFVGFELAKCFWDAGVPKDVLQFIPSFDSKVAMQLTKSKAVEMIVFTGGTNTALSIIKSNPSVKMIAETGGKNVTIVTKFADRDGAIKNVLQSAFSNSGQKCSATSILALEKEIYEDEKFLHTLVDAAESLTVDGAWNFKTKVNPLIRKPLPDLEYALTQVEPHEKWLLKPKCLNKKQTLWSPGIKIGTRPGDKSHEVEFFGPVLTIMKIENLQEGIKLVNSTGYGLTSALESLNEEEHLVWKEGIQAGNLYINRSSTGAIVERQPFGGMNKSAFGCGIKAGGLNYIYQFFDFKDGALNLVVADATAPHYNLRDILIELKTSKKELHAAFCDYLNAYNNYFGREFDYQEILGQSNVTRFLKLENIAIRADKNAEIEKVILAILAAKISAQEVTLSIDADSNLIAEIEKISPAILWKVEVANSDAASFAANINSFKRVRLIGNISEEILREAAAPTGLTIIADEVVSRGRVELLHYLQEQSVSNNYHRFGYIPS